MALRYRGRITFRHQSEYFAKLKKLLEAVSDDKVFEKAARAGANPVADQIRKNLEALPEEEFHKLNEGEVFHGVPKGQKKDLLSGLGVTEVRKDSKGFIHAKIGFEGFGDYPTNGYPDGIPIPLLAAAVESGSSVRQKTPFIAPAVKATHKQAIEAMEKVIDEELKKIFD